MKNRYILLLSLSVCISSSIFGVPDCQATIFDVTLDTSQLVGNAAGPFYVNFQLIDGSGTGDANNTVTIDNFVLGVVSMTDSKFLNEFTGQFNPGSSLSFRVKLTTKVDGRTPDAFSFAILDSTLTRLPTTGLGDSLLVLHIDGNPLIETFPTIEGSAIQLSAPEVRSISVPDTESSISILAIALGAIWCFASRTCFVRSMSP